MLIRGTANGVSVIRIVEWTVPVEVTTGWVYYRRIIWQVVAAIAFFGLLFWMYRWANPQRSKAPGLASPIGGFGGSPPTDDLADFVSPTSRSVCITGSPTNPAPRNSEPSPPRELPRNDDLDDFLQN